MSGKKYLEFLKEDQRLCLLRLLVDCGGSANDSVLHTGLEALGHVRLSRDEVRDLIRFLVDRGCITDEWFGNVQILKITRRGVDVAKGNTEVDGIKMPALGE